MFKKCLIKSCNTTKAGDGITLHPFPMHCQIENEWIRSISEETGQTEFGNDDIICSKHFSKECFTFIDGIAVLNSTAVPFVKSGSSGAKRIRMDNMEYHSKNQHFVKEEIKEEKEDIIQNKSRRSLRKRANLEEKTILIKLYEEGKSITECANAIGLNISTAKSIIRRYKEDGEELIQRPWGGNRRSILTTELLQIIENLIEKNPEITLREMEFLLTKMGHVMSKSTIHNALLSMKLTIRIAQPEEELMNSVSAILSRKSFSIDFIENHPQNLEKCIFIDDCGYNIHLRKSQGRGRNATVILAMNNKRIIHHRIYTTLTLNINRFLVFLEELVQCMTVNEDMNGAWMIMSSEQVYNNNEVKATLSSASYVQKILPLFSPNFNPVRKMFFKIKYDARNLFNNDQNEDKMAVNIIDDTIKLLSSSDCSTCVKDAMGEYRKVLSDN